ncbi:uncharacterized protein LOC111325899 [Stylophora pistillata]|uniref:uncharacterized protein LOC111325899 n=1 Tax=Stylophora pistillata TaxID=50429 RepID=UPI000C04BA7F|nr:uncharacterized protein LOC111325899 [Stylophora pistillata]
MVRKTNFDVQKFKDALANASERVTNIAKERMKLPRAKVSEEKETDKDHDLEDDEVTFGPAPASTYDALEKTVEDEGDEGLPRKCKNNKKKKKNKKNKRKREPEHEQEVIEPAEKKTKVE